MQFETIQFWILTSSSDTPTSSALSMPILIMLEDKSIATTLLPYSCKSI